MTDDRFEQVLHNFIGSDMRQAQIQGLSSILAELFREIVKAEELPIEVIDKRNVIYFKRTDMLNDSE